MYNQENSDVVPEYIMSHPQHYNTIGVALN
jgi:hypothetical protein